MRNEDQEETAAGPVDRRNGAANEELANAELGGGVGGGIGGGTGIKIGLLLAAAGLVGAVVLLADQDLSSVFDLLRTGGFGLVVATLLHIPSMVLNGHAWAVLLPRRRRPSLWLMSVGVWLRESVNGLLPVARVGGEIAAYRLLRGQAVPVPPAISSLMIDTALSILSQIAFSILGLMLLAGAGAAFGWWTLGAALGCGVVMGLGFMAAQRFGLFSRLIHALNGMASGKLTALAGHSVRIDRFSRRVWRNRPAILWCFLWQMAGWCAGSLEIWFASRVLGHPLGLMEALGLEAMIQAIVSAAFLVPGALGVQEGGFIALGALLGMDPATATALALARRLRDVLLFVPGLGAWAWMEHRGSRKPRPVAQRLQRP